MLSFSVSWALRCMRYSYFAYYTKPKLSRRLEEKGRLTERRAEMALKYTGKKIWRGKTRELYFKDFTLVGRADFVSDNEVIEVKTRLSSAFLVPNMAQLNLYMLMEGKDNGILLSGDGRFLRLERSEFLIRQSLRYFEALAEHITYFDIPEGDRTFCRNCHFRRFCVD